MAKVRRLQTSFIAGQLDPAVALRSDLEQYYDGAAILRDVLPITLGGLKRRPGLEYIAGVHSNDEAILIEFQFNDEQKYLFVVQAARIDIYSVPDDSLVATLTASPVSNITIDMLDTMCWTQSADTLILFHPDLQPISITRTGATTFASANVAFTNIPVYPFSTVTVTHPAQTLTPSGTTGTITLAAGGGTIFSGSTDGQFVEINDGLVYLTGHTSATVATGYVREALQSTTMAASGAWTLETGYEAVFSASRGWPRSGVFHEERLWLGGLKSRPATMLGSKVADYFNLDEGSGRDADAINATIQSNQLNAINNIFSGRTLQIFTSGGEYSVPKSTVLSPITPGNVSFIQQTNHGSPNIRPVNVDGATIYYDRKDLRQFVYNDLQQSYTSPSLNLLATDILSNIVDMDLRRSTSSSNASYVFCVNDDGTLAVLNTLSSQNINAWVEWTTLGLFKRVRAVGDDVYFITQRSINNVDVRYIEKINDALKLDCSKQITAGGPTTGWNGLAHLNGETVKVLGDNFVQPDAAVSGGSSTTGDSVTVAEFGLAYYAYILPLPFAGVFFGEDVTAKMKRKVKAWLRVNDTRNILVDGYRPPLTNMEDAMDAVPSLTSDFVGVALGGYDRFCQAEITQDECVEFELYGFVMEIGIA